jgi:glycosyltransferase involved in cell wall biosynthesis
LSYALLEAMGHGLAIVASDGHGNPEAVGDAGLEFPVGDREALVAALVRLSSDPALRSRLGARAAVRVRDHFTADRFIAETEAVYRQALGRVTEPAQAGAGSSA